MREPIATQPVTFGPEGVRHRRLVMCFLAVLAFAITCGVYGVMLRRHLYCDFSKHAEDAHQLVTTFRLPPHFLYFLVLGVSRLFSQSLTMVLGWGVVVMGVAVGAKWLIATRIATHELKASVKGGRALPIWVCVGLFLLLFAHSLPRTPLYFTAAGQPWPSAFSAYCFYAGRATSTIWHNSTMVFAMPFVLLLFHESSLLLTRDGAASTSRLLVLVALNAFSKPSFLLAMAPVLPLLVFARHRLGRPFLVAAVTVGLVLALLAAQRLWLAARQPSGYEVRVDWLRVWGPFAPVFPLDLLGSFAYPLLFAALFPRVALSDRLYLYAAALTAVAVLIGATLCESAPFTYSGNLMWQVHMCCCVWFLATFLGHARVLSAASGRLGTRDVLALACLSGHVVNGMAYLVRTLTTRTFM